MLGSPTRAVDADHSAAWKGSAVQSARRLAARRSMRSRRHARSGARSRVGEGIHPSCARCGSRACSRRSSGARIRANQPAGGRKPIAARNAWRNETRRLTLHGRADRIDRLADGRVAIIDYKTASRRRPGSQAGSRCNWALIGLSRGRWFPRCQGVPGAHELVAGAGRKGGFGLNSRRTQDCADAFLGHSSGIFLNRRPLICGDEPFTAKLHPAYRLMAIMTN